MKKSSFTSVKELPIMLSVSQVAAVLYMIQGGIQWRMLPLRHLFTSFP